MLGDMVKGKLMKDIHPEVRQGVLLHRQIDAFTDSHAIVLEVIANFKPTLGRYAGIAVDVLFDHYLAKNWSSYHILSFEQYQQDLFKDYRSVSHQLTEKMCSIADLIEERKWMFQYQSLEGLQNIYEQMSKRVDNRVFFPASMPVIDQKGGELEKLFVQFFQELQGEFSFST